MIQNNLPNLLLIAGTGRNVGKTTFACKIIEQESAYHDCFAIKISPHFHKLDEKTALLFVSEDFMISEEFDKTSEKDSSRMLQAGAKRVFYIQTKKDFTWQAFVKAIELLPEKPCIICEAGGLSESVIPGIFAVCANSHPEKNLDYLQKADVVYIDFCFDNPKITFNNNRWEINKH